MAGCDDAAMWLPSSPTSGAILRFLPGALVLIVTSALVIRHGFDGMYGQDAFGYVNYALGPMRDALLHLEGPPAWPQPPGYPMVVATASLIVGPDGRIGQVVSLLAGASVPVLVALLATEAVGRHLVGRAAIAVPLLAGLLAALPGQLWQSSTVAMADTLAIALAIAAAYGVCRYARSGRIGWLLVAAATTAFAIDTRWIYGLVAVPIALVGLIGIRRVLRLERRRAVVHALAATLTGAAVLAPVMLPMGLAILHGTAVPFAADFGAYDWDPLNALRSSFETTDGHLVYDLTSGLYYLLQPVMSYWFGPVGLLVVWGAAWIVRRGEAVNAALLVGWPLIVLVFLAGAPYQNPRFLLAALPPLAVLAAVGTWRLAMWVDARLPADRRRTSLVAGATLAAAWLVVTIGLAARYADEFIDRQTRDLAATRNLEAMIPTGSRVISLGPTGVFLYDRLPDVVELFFLTPSSANALLEDRQPSYLVIDPAAISEQWAGRGPALTVDAIRSSHGLAPIADAGVWTLYRIGPSS